MNEKLVREFVGDSVLINRTTQWKEGKTEVSVWKSRDNTYFIIRTWIMNKEHISVDGADLTADEVIKQLMDIYIPRGD